MKKFFVAFIAFICLATLCGCELSKSANSNSVPTIGIETYLTTTEPSLTVFETTTPFTYSTTIADEQPIITTITTVDDEESDTVITTEYYITDYEAEMYCTSLLNVRSGPGTEYDRVGQLAEGDEVSITGKVSNGWYRIHYKGEEAYVSGKYLTDVAPEPVVTTTITTTVITTTTPAPTTVTTTEEEIEIDDEEEIVVEDDYEVTDFPVIGNLRSTINYTNQKAVWFAYLDLDTWLKDATKDSFTSNVRQAFANVKALGCNTVYVHTRAFGDAYYYSDIFPFVASYSGTVGVRAPFDPLEIMIEEAHSLGLSFHAWINPMRTTKAEKYADMSSNYQLKQWYSSSSTNGTYLVYDKSTEYYWLSPAYQSVRQLICDGVAEIVLKYNVDGIHIDDYFYPTTDASFDKLAFAQSGKTDLAQWRRDTVSNLVADIYTTVKICNPNVLFGVSPQGNISNNRDVLYADVEKWCSTPGYLDYVVPQIYYGFTTSLPFDKALNEWHDAVTLPNVQLICGIGAYKVGTDTEWSSGNMLSKQTQMAMSLSKYTGCAYYRYGSMYSIVGSSGQKLMANELNKLTQTISLF